jgi:hypothetical protein
MSRSNRGWNRLPFESVVLASALGSLAVLLTAMSASTLPAQSTPVPLISQPLVPSSAAPGGAAFTLTVNGNGFSPESVVEWNGAELYSVVVSGEQITATVAASDIASAGTAAVTVVTPGIPASNVVYFPISGPPVIFGFGLQDLSTTFTQVSNVVTGDFNGDGIPDLAVQANNAIEIFLGNGDGTFQAPIFTSTGYTGFGGPLAVGDFNNDGKLDVVHLLSSRVQVYLGNGNGTLTSGASYITDLIGYPATVAVGDFNGDGKLDFVTNLCNLNPYECGTGTFLGNGDGTFQPPSALSAPIEESGIMAVGDFDGDGILDLATAGSCNDAFSIEITLGNGDGTFQNPITYATNYCPNDVVIADFNGDGKLDLAASTSGNTVDVLLGNGNGTFGSATSYPVGGQYGAGQLLVGDFSNDGKTGIAVLSGNSIDNTSGVSVLLGNGNGTFQTYLTFPTDPSPLYLALGDFNRDGRLDLAVTAMYFEGTTGTVSILLQGGISLTPGTLTYSQQDVGTSSPPQTATLTNYGSSALTINSISFTGTDPTDFSETNTCGTSLASGASCSISVTFKPNTIGTLTATMNVNDSASNSPQTVSLTGSAIGPTVTFSPSSLTFGTTLIGVLSPPQSISVSNTGAGTLNITSITASSGFMEANNCGSSLAPTAVCTITVQFDPTQTGITTGTISMVDNAPGSPQTVSLSGTGTAVVVSPIGVYFGTQADGTSSSPVNVTLTNKGASALTITSITLTGANPGDFAETNNCGSSLGGGRSCTITVTFTPTALGLRSAAVTITDSDPTSPQSVSLSGTGVIAGPSVVLSATSLTFATQPLNSTSASQAVTLTDNGSAAVNITSITASANFTETNTCGSSVASGANCTINVSFAPTAVGTITGTVTIVDNAGTQTIALSGSAQGLVPIPGNVAQIRVGGNGSVYALNSSQEIYSYNFKTDTWTLLPGKLVQIAVGADGSLWGVNSSQQVFSYAASSNTWTQINGVSLTQIAVGYTDVVWGLTSTGQIYRYDPGTNGWDLIPGQLTQIAVGPDGAVWGVNSKNEIYHFDTRLQTWDLIRGALTQVAVGYGGVVWGVNSTQQIFQFSVATQSFTQVQGTFTQVSVGTDGTVWAVDAGQGDAYRYDPTAPGSWDVFPMPAPMSQISVGYSGAVWAADSFGNAYQFQPTSAEPAKTLHEVAGTLVQVAVAGDGNVWGINSSGLIYAFDSATQSWDLVTGGLTQISVGFGGAVWGINSKQQIFNFNPSTQLWTLIPGALTQIAVGSANAVWGINASGQVYQYTGGKWNQRSGVTAVQIGVAPDGTVWALNAQQQIYSYNSQTQSWTLVSGLLTNISVGSATVIWGINSSEDIYSYNTQTKIWDLEPGLLKQLGVGPDGVPWGFNNAGTVYEFNLSTGNWNQISGSTLTAISVGADEAVWGLNGTQIYRAH